MIDPPRTADDYAPEDLELVKSTCLEVATRFGDLMDDMVIVGGLVPALLVDLARDETAPTEDGPMERHVGTQDLDLGFAVAVLDDETYAEIAKRLRTANFQPDTNDDGNTVTHRWFSENEPRIKVDFLMPPSDASSEGGSPKHLQGDFSAIVTPGLELAFENIQHVELKGQTLRGASARHEIPVCNPGAFVLLKALAGKKRGKDKDDYDLYYLLRNYDDSLTEVASFFSPYLRAQHPAAEEAVSTLQERFESNDSVGPIAVSEFVHGQRNEATEADAYAFVQDFLDALDEVD
jgi:hypothetical protein